MTCTSGQCGSTQWNSNNKFCPILQEEVQLKRELAGPLSQLQETSRSIAEVQRECKLEVNADEYVESFKPFLMDVIHAWSKVRNDDSSLHSILACGQICSQTRL